MIRSIALRAYVPSFAIMLSVALAGCGDSSNPKHDSGVDTAAASAQDASLDRSPASTSSDAGTTDLSKMDLLQTIDAQPGAPADASVSDWAPTETSSPDAPVGGAVDAAPIASNDGAVASADVSPASDTNAVLSRLDVSPVDTGSAVDTGSVDMGSAPQKLGVVILAESSVTMNVAGLGIMNVISSSATAAFGVTEGASTCETTTSGDCQFMKCSSTSSSAAANYLAAGTVTINGLASPVSLTLQSSNAYLSTTPYATYLWTSSRPLTVVVSGSSDVPAFSLAVTAPNPISLTSPPAQGYASNGFPSYPVSRATDLLVKWTGGIEGTVSVGFSSSDNTVNQTTQINCSVAASKGTLVVPAAFLAKLSSSADFTVSQNNLTWSTVGDWMMEFSTTIVAAPGVAAFSD